ncbi:MAG: hypothetical protein V4736_13690, partial [Bdellovibrionota bacterium]
GNIRTGYATTILLEGSKPKTPLFLTINFPLAMPIKNLKIFSGYGKSKALFAQNHRIKSMRITSTYELSKKELTFDKKFDLKDDFESQTVSLGIPLAKTIRVEILELYKGSKFNDLVISELNLSAGR